MTDDKIYEVASNGTRIIETIIQNRTYKSEYIRHLIRLLITTGEWVIEGKANSAIDSMNEN